MKLMEVLAFQGYQLCIGGSSTQTETRGWSTKPFSGQAHRQVQKTAECGIPIQADGGPLSMQGRDIISTYDFQIV